VRGRIVSIVLRERYLKNLGKHPDCEVGHDAKCQAATFKIDRGDVEKDEIQLAEQAAVFRKEHFLDFVL
jgi:hypothetical protein